MPIQYCSCLCHRTKAKLSEKLWISWFLLHGFWVILQSCKYIQRSLVSVSRVVIIDRLTLTLDDLRTVICSEYFYAIIQVRNMGLRSLVTCLSHIESGRNWDINPVFLFVSETHALSPYSSASYKRCKTQQKTEEISQELILQVRHMAFLLSLLFLLSGILFLIIFYYELFQH